jgi:hypothetical protein
MGATEEQMSLLNANGVDHVSYILILYSVAFLTFLCKCRRSPRDELVLTAAVANVLIFIYASSAMPAGTKDGETQNGRLTNGARLARDAEEFELDGLTSEDEEANEAHRLLKEQAGVELESP